MKQIRLGVAHAAGSVFMAAAVILLLFDGDRLQRIAALALGAAALVFFFRGTRKKTDAALLERLPEAGLLCRGDDGFTIKSIGGRFLALTGYSEEEIDRVFDRRYANLIYPADLEAVRSSFRKQKEGTGIIELRYRLRDKTGKRLHILEKRVRQNGRAGVYLCLLSDITAETTFGEKAEHMLNNMPGGMVKCSAMKNGEIEFISRGALALWGYTEESFRKVFQNRFANAVHPHDRARYSSALAAQGTVEDEETVLQHRILTASGEVRWVHNVVRLTVDSEGKRSYFNTIVDITSFKTIEQELSNSRQRLEAVNNNLLGGIVIAELDEHLTMSYTNDGFLKMLGYARDRLEESAANRLFRLFYREDAEKAAESIGRQLEERDHVDVECRFTKSDGSVIWAVIKGNRFVNGEGKAVLGCVIVDITESKRIAESLRQSEERYRIVAAQSNSVIFDYSFADGTFSHFDRLDKLFGIPSGLGDESDPANGLASKVTHAFYEKAIHPEDYAKFRLLFDRLRRGAGRSISDVRLQNGSGGYIWCSVRLSAIRDNEGVLQKAVGKIINIDLQRRETEVFKVRATLDPLTGVLNKTNCESRIDEWLAANPGKKQALCFVDIDYFKSVNDRFGHRAGDAVLEQTGALLRQIFSNSIIGRVGGDEFVVLVTDMKNVGALRERLAAFKKQLVQVKGKEGGDLFVTASVGIAFFPEHGSDYESLYVKADRALYKVKNNGRDHFGFYDKLLEEEERGEAPIGQEEKEAYRIFSSSDIRTATLEMLYASEDVRASAAVALRYAGVSTGVDRILVFEERGADGAIVNSFAWANRRSNIPYADENGLISSSALVGMSLTDEDLLERLGVTPLVRVDLADSVGCIVFEGRACEERQRILRAVGMLTAAFLQKGRMAESLSAAR